MEILKFEESLYVLGNQAADLDSTVSALSLTALIRILNPGLKVLPLIQGSSDDLRLKPEIPSLLERAGVTADEYSFLHDESLPDMDSRIILVDHNRPDFPGLESSVAGIVDHHRDESFLKELPLRIIRRSGSCATLVAELWRKSDTPIPPDQLLLLFSAIVVDTGDLDPVWGKTTPQDREIYEYLSSRLPEEEQSFALSLQKVKLDLSHLNQMDQLRRDFKVFHLPCINGGISSVPMGVKDFFALPFFDSAEIESFMKKRCPDLLIIMHSENTPFRRQFSFYCAGDSDRSSFGLTSLIQETLKELGGFTPQPSPAEGWYCFDQEDASMSRKVLSPRLKEKLEHRIIGSTSMGPERRGKK